MKNQLYVIANWKEYPDNQKEAGKIATALAKKTVPKNIAAIVCPPHPFLETVGTKIKKGKYALGAQDLSPMMLGAYTGEVGGKALASLGVKYAIIGHSERREMGESNELTLQKIRAACATGIRPILCVGEKSRETADASHKEVSLQLSILRDLSKKDLEKLVIAYEPVWAIGTKTPATPEAAREMRIYIQKVLADTIGQGAMKHIPILYGAAVNPKNAKEFINIAGMQGLLVGRASLDPKAFLSILSAVQ